MSQPRPLVNPTRPIPSRRPKAALRLVAALALLVAAGADDPETNAPIAPPATPVDRLLDALGRVPGRFVAWYRDTPATSRITWGGLAACALFGAGVTAERMLRLRRERVLPEAFAARFQRRLEDGQIDRERSLDYCELNPSPAARLALAAVGRWGRPTADLERAVALARRREVDALSRHVGTLRRLAALAPLVGLLGGLAQAGQILRQAQANAAIGSALADALAPLTAGVAIAILALVAYDGLSGKVEALAAELDRIGAETVDAIALATGSDLRLHPGAAPRPPHQAPRGTVSEGRLASRTDDLP
jgi:biopolymer transport protein ExbB